MEFQNITTIGSPLLLKAVAKLFCSGMLIAAGPVEAGNPCRDSASVSWPSQFLDIGPAPS